MNYSFAKIISHLFPVLVTSDKGEVNPYLEVRLEGGKYVLNSASVNYSFGGLHTIFKKVFGKYDFSNRKIDKVLILGFGAGSVASLLRKNKSITCPITGVEQDKVVIKLMKKYFHPEEYAPLELIQGDAFEYVMNTKESYDIIVVDVFIEDNVPEQFIQQNFIRSLKNTLSPEGIIFFNKMVNTFEHKREVEDMQVFLTDEFGSIHVERIHKNGTENWVFVHDRFLGNLQSKSIGRFKVVPVINLFPDQPRPALGMWEV